ncbi:hypothetical protein [Rhodohalobacter sp.]|uniref:hypothetical protein n=1 Tax=Rhodohalobacter sp. TaxID=1974210 RepID=UPI002ACE8947|nr:hypothetical protein [Rhodohalobacter sp.]MDZ7756929.1 hypothetical protein [Rhodohalobacter sp.]
MEDNKTSVKRLFGQRMSFIKLLVNYLGKGGLGYSNDSRDQTKCLEFRLNAVYKSNQSSLFGGFGERIEHPKLTLGATIGRFFEASFKSRRFILCQGLGRQARHPLFSLRSKRGGEFRTKLSGQLKSLFSRTHPLSPSLLSLFVKRGNYKTKFEIENRDRCYRIQLERSPLCLQRGDRGESEKT